MNRAFASILVLLGMIFLVIPLTADTFSHYVQDKTFQRAQESVVSCRAQLALSAFSAPHSLLAGPKLERNLDLSCGKLPVYVDFSYSSNGILSLYNWVGQKVTFIPI